MWFKRKPEQPPVTLEPTEAPVAAPEQPAQTAQAEAPAPQEAEAPAEQAEQKGFWSKTWDFLNKPIFVAETEAMSQALEKTKSGFIARIKKLGNRWTKIDEDMLEELEEILLESDVGLAVAEGAIAHVRAKHKLGEVTPENLSDVLEAYLREQLGESAPLPYTPNTLNIIMLVGVNGVGKTTTLGKLARRYQIEGRKVLIAAADTFRAAAIEQVAIWAERSGVDLIRHKEGGDAAAVVFDAIRAAKARGVDTLLIDTAGRLHNKSNLMAELQKVRKIIEREAPEAPVEALLVLDATTGQNGLRQAEVFQEATKLTGVILTKLDGTAKGGVVFGIKQQLDLPVRLVGLGEKVEDLKDFDAGVYVDALFSEEAKPEA
ncbi:signal recognition particle-docking protein FtsY [bacterium]|nr:signal recognition particle-docking protein FtsY [bacterium]